MSEQEKQAYSRYAWMLIAAVAIAVSLTGLRNGFAFDDVYVIAKNPRLHTLADPWGLLTATYWSAPQGSMLYRPSAMIAFAIEWAAGSGSPFPFHAVSVALYAAVSVAVYRLASILMSPRAALIGGIVFAVHPLHVEAVANVVGQSELWVALILLVLVRWYITIRRDGAVALWQVGVISLAYLIACGFKEHAIVLPMLLVAAEFLVIPDGSSPASRARRLVPLLTCVGVAALVFLTIRYSVLHGVAIDSRAEILKQGSFGTRFFTMLAVVVEWVRLFFWPMNLSADYSYPRISVHTAFEPSMLPAIGVIAGTILIAWTIRKRHPAATFGMAWGGIALLIPSNLVVVTGFVLAERTLFLATAGFALALGVLVHEGLLIAEQKGSVRRTLAIASVSAFVVIFAARSVTRSPVWRDNDTLFSQTVLDVPSSFRAHWMRAMLLADQKRTAEALEEMDVAVALGDRKDPLLLAYSADMFAVAGRCRHAVPLYSRALALAPQNVQLRANAAFCLLAIGDVETARSVAMADTNAVNDVRIRATIKTADSLLASRRSGT